MAKIIQDNSVLRLRDGLDLAKMNLTAQEGFILSRVNGVATVHELYQMSFLDKASTASVLKKLLDVDVIEIVEKKGEPAKEKEAEIELPKRDLADYHFNPLELNEEVELPLEMRKEILFVFENMENWTFYDLLCVSSSASREEVKKAFLRLSRVYHPDNYFRKNLGSYQTKVNAIYSQLVQANGILADPIERSEYRRKLIEEGRIVAGPEDILEDPRERERRLAREKVQRRVQHNPLMKRVEKAREFYEAALADVAKEAFISAANNFKLAMTCDPNNELYKIKSEQVRDQANRARAERIFQKGMMLESYGQEGYFEAFIQAAQTFPAGAIYNFKVASLYWDQADAKEALPFAKRAVQSEPSNTEYRLLLAQILIKLKDKNEAISQLEALLRIDPNNASAKSLLKEAKKWF